MEKLLKKNRPILRQNDVFAFKNTAFYPINTFIFIT